MSRRRKAFNGDYDVILNREGKIDIEVDNIHISKCTGECETCATLGDRLEHEGRAWEVLQKLLLQMLNWDESARPSAEDLSGMLAIWAG